jgi:hypothetical protein
MSTLQLSVDDLPVGEGGDLICYDFGSWFADAEELAALHKQDDWN